MLGVIVLALASASASPPPPPLKTIIHERASPVCTALREVVGPAVKALLQNKPVIGDGKALFFKIAQDNMYAPNPRMRIDMHMQQLDDLIEPMVRNLAATDASLNKLSYLPQVARNDDERSLIAMRTQLMSIADEQRKMLNVFSGTYNSYTSNELLQHSNPLAGAVAQSSSSTVQKPAAPDESAPVTFVVPPNSDKGTPAPHPASSPDAAMPESRYEGLLAYSPFAQLYNELTTYQLHEMALESTASQTILQTAAQCR